MNTNVDYTALISRSGPTVNPAAALSRRTVVRCLLALPLLLGLKGRRREREVRPWVGYLVLPLFAICNAGIDLSTVQLHEAISDPVTIGVFAGLTGGKLLGILGSVALGVALGLFKLPENTSWPQMIGVALLAGVGFTVSLFIVGLALGGELIASAKLGILAASILSAVVGYAALLVTSPRRAR